MSEILSANAALSSLVHRLCDVGQHGKAVFGHFGKSAEHDDFFVAAAAGHGENSRPDRRHHRGVAREHAEIALDAGDINLVDFAGEGELFRRDEIEVEGGHGDLLSRLSPAGLTRGSII